MLKKALLSVLSLVLIAVTVLMPHAMEVQAAAKTDITIHYKPAADNTKDWSLWLWESGKDGKAYPFNDNDSFGKVASYALDGKITTVGFIVRTEDWEKDIGEDRFVENIQGETEIWLISGDPTIYTSNPEGGSDTAQKSFDEIKVKLHYHRVDNQYEGWKLWLWPDGKKGASYAFTGKDEFGVYAEVTVKNTGDVKRLGFKIGKGTSESNLTAKEFDERFIKKFTDEGTAEVWIAQNQETVNYKQEYVDLAPAILSATLEDLKTVLIETSVPFQIANNKDEGFTVAQGNNSIPIASVTLLNKDEYGLATKVQLVTAQDLDFQHTYQIAKDNYKSVDVTYGQAMFNKPVFDQLYRYEGNDLGPVYTADNTKLRVWAPTAAEVKVVTYSAGVGGNATEQAMTKAEKGTWTAQLSGDQHGTFYTYKVFINGKWNEAVDPYAKSVSINGDRGVILDLARTNPEGWDAQNRPKVNEAVDAIIYELHVRDLSIAANSGIQNKGKFLGLTETGTKGPDGKATGLDYMKELGVTHIQLLPIFDYNSVDESKLDQPSYNWGYDPKNYNAPEGSYSTDPNNPVARVNELKQAIQALHNNGLEVIMDVVYNHMHAVDPSNLNKLVPGYYFRYDNDGKLSNGSGVGNDTASERSMVRKLIVDSVAYWAEEYKLDGYRFDLMGIHDVQTMNDVRTALDRIDSKMLIIGEGWVLGTLLDEKLKANQKNAERMLRIGQFNDYFRDGVKGSVFSHNEGGFINGLKTNKTKVMGGIVGGIRYSYAIGHYAVSPDQSVNYVEAHDNNTLWDKLLLTNPDDSEETRMKMAKIGGALVLTSQGISFLHAGQEFLRTKGGNDNSYNSPDAVNLMDWDRKAKYEDVVSYYKGMIELRKSHPAFRMTTAEQIKENLVFLNTAQEMIGYTIGNHANGDSWETIAVFHNTSKESQKATLPAGKWKVVMNGERAGIEVISSLEGNDVVVPALTSMVLYSGEDVAQAVPQEQQDGKSSDESTTGKSMNVIWTLIVLLAAAAIGWVMFKRSRNV
ncbi:MAG: type I pullulanase [Candidatus Cohnella colombiensis]|uniref:pullulanase n=1 Tax=Candidatus Cohnella colombiensis TaxID=3121368 RepID=A0AA95EZ91_9BACL|nr:MAG: type I pullulanase [Cohnella sp.]